MQIVAIITDSFLAADNSPCNLAHPCLRWAAYADDGQRTGAVQRGDLNALHAAISEADDKRNPLRRLVILLGAEFCRIATINVPRTRSHRMSQLVAYTLEEAIADDIEQQHIVYQRIGRSTSVRCVAIAHDQMEAMSSWLHLLKVDHLILIPDGLAILVEGERQLWLTAKDRVLYTDTSDIFAAWPSTLETVLAPPAPPGEEESARSAPITVIVSTGARSEAAKNIETALRRHGVEVRQGNAEELLDRAAAMPGSHDASNLLQGTYKPPKHLSRHQKLATRVALVLGAVWLLHIVSDIALGVAYSHRATALRAHTEQVASQYVTVNPHVDLVRQLKGLIRASSRQTGNASFASLFTRFINALEQNHLIKQAQPDTIHFQSDKGILTADLTVPSIQFGDQVIAALGAQSLNAKLVSATRQKQGAAIRVDVSAR